MYKMIIVDDDESVRKGLKISIDWSEINIRVVGLAKNGEEALKMVKEEKPEFVITDIYMPKMDGLELTIKIKEVVPYAKVIILSGYEDFDYARTAIRNNAYDYILKPIKAEKMIKIVKKAKKVIDQEMLKLQDERDLKKQLKESLPVLKERYLDYLLSRRLSLEYIKENYKYIELDIEDKKTVVLVIELDDIEEMEAKKDEERQIIMLSIKRALNSILNQGFQGEIITHYPNRFVIIMNYENNNNIIKEITSLCNKMKNFLEDYFDHSITIGIGGLYDDSEQIVNSYQEAIEALEYKIFFGKGNIIYIGDVAINKKQNKYNYPFEQENKIITALKIGDVENIEKYIGEFTTYYLDNNNTFPEEFKRACIQLIYYIFRNLIYWNYSIDIAINSIEEKIKRAKSHQKVEKYMKRYINNIASKIIQKKESEYNHVVKKVCEYIEEKYSQNINLEDIANSVYLTSNYLSNLFKEETGKTIMNYLTEIRLKKAKKLLLNTEYKVFEVAEKVGYKDARYFSQVFKKNVGITPTTFRNN